MCVCVSVCAYIILHIFLCVYVYMYVCVCVCVCVYIHTNISSIYHYSYSYDITHTLQYNMSPCKGISPDTVPQSPETELKFWNTWNKDSHIHDSGCHHQDIEDASSAVKNFLDKVGRERKDSSDSEKSLSPDPDNDNSTKSPMFNGIIISNSGISI